MKEGALFSTPFPAFVICWLVNEGHSDWCEVVPLLSFLYITCISLWSILDFLALHCHRNFKHLPLWLQGYLNDNRSRYLLPSTLSLSTFWLWNPPPPGPRPLFCWESITLRLQWSWSHPSFHTYRDSLIFWLFTCMLEDVVVFKFMCPFKFKIFFFVQPSLWHMEVPGPEIKSELKLWTMPQLQQCCILNSLHHSGNSKFNIFWFW